MDKFASELLSPYPGKYITKTRLWELVNEEGETLHSKYNVGLLKPYFPTKKNHQQSNQWDDTTPPKFEKEPSKYLPRSESRIDNYFDRSWSPEEIVQKSTTFGNRFIRASTVSLPSFIDKNILRIQLTNCKKEANDLASNLPVVSRGGNNEASAEKKKVKSSSRI